MPDFVDEILDAFLLCIVSSGFFTRRISAVFVPYRQFRILYTTDLGNSENLDLHSEPVQREGEGQNTTLHSTTAIAEIPHPRKFIRRFRLANLSACSHPLLVSCTTYLEALLEGIHTLQTQNVSVRARSVENVFLTSNQITHNRRAPHLKNPELTVSEKCIHYFIYKIRNCR